MLRRSRAPSPRRRPEPIPRNPSIGMRDSCPRQTMACGYGPRPSPGRRRGGLWLQLSNRFPGIASETIQSHARDSGLLRRLRSSHRRRRDITKHPRGAFRPSYAQPTRPSESSRAQGRPGARNTPTAPAQKRLRERALTTGGAASRRPSLRSGLRLIRALLGEPSCLPPSQATTRWASSPTWRQMLGAPGPHDFAVRADYRFALRPVRVHRIPAHVRDDRDTPLDARLEQNGNIKEARGQVKRSTSTGHPRRREPRYPL